jgi:hypothetical protein
MDLDEESIEMTVFDKLMECKHNEIVSKNDDGSMSIENTSNLFHFGQHISPDNTCLDNNNNDEIAYPFSKGIKIKHEPERSQENKPVQYTADIIVEIKNRWYRGDHYRFAGHRKHRYNHLHRFLQKGRAHTNTNKRNN